MTYLITKFPFFVNISAAGIKSLMLQFLKKSYAQNLHQKDNLHLKIVHDLLKVQIYLVHLFHFI